MARVREPRSDYRRFILTGLPESGVVRDLVEPREVDRDPPVDADHVTARFREIGENRGRADPEMNERHAEGGQLAEDPCRVRQRELAIIGAAERARP